VQSASIHKAFLALIHVCFPTLILVPCAPVNQRRGHTLLKCPFA
jgi:hypothetical protein